MKSAEPSGISYQSDYGKQTGPKHCKTPLTYGPGEGSGLDSRVECFYENYVMANWDSQFLFNGEEFDLPRNNLGLDKWAVKHERFENLVSIRHRSASRERNANETVPNNNSESVLNNYWMSKELPYTKNTVPKPLSGEEGVSFVRVDKMKDQS